MCGAAVGARIHHLACVECAAGARVPRRQRQRQRQRQPSRALCRSLSRCCDGGSCRVSLFGCGHCTALRRCLAPRAFESGGLTLWCARRMALLFQTPAVARSTPNLSALPTSAALRVLHSSHTRLSIDPASIMSSAAASADSAADQAHTAEQLRAFTEGTHTQTTAASRSTRTGAVRTRRMALRATLMQCACVAMCVCGLRLPSEGAQGMFLQAQTA